MALLSSGDAHPDWSVRTAERFPPPWTTCEAALCEAHHLLGTRGSSALYALLRRGALRARFDLDANVEPVIKLLEKYVDRPASLADACLVRMTEVLSSPMLLTTDSDFAFYRRHGRQVVPCVLPP
ncbi:MAG TPA: pilus assembly protein [Gammaproteobacteria bacterium]|nr:pilus assembly protein [Gammaproteobacteria bacterium]